MVPDRVIRRKSPVDLGSRQSQLLVRTAGTFLSFAFLGSVASATGTAEPGPSNGTVDPKVQQLQLLQQVDQRVAEIGWRLATSNLELCPAHFAGTGLGLHALTQYSGPFRQAAQKAYGLDGKYPGVLTVANGSPAAKVGIRAGDVIVSVNGQPLLGPGQSSDVARYAATDASMDKIEALPVASPAKFEVERRGVRMTFELTPSAVCASRFELAPGSDFNDNSNGRVVQIAGGLLASLDSDDDLALVMAHELAHNALGHNQAIEEQHLPTGLGAIFSKGGKKLRDQEREADRYGIFMAARAGYQYKQAASFWENLTRKSGLGAWWATTHPTAGNRKRNAAAAIADIERLKSRSEPLVPSSQGAIASDKPNATGN